MKIGFFDSGLGGLTILKAVAAQLPQYNFMFYGDTANLPYGDKTEEEIYSLTTDGVKYLFENDCVLVIIACNTASAETARRLQTDFLPNNYPDRKILGIIVPTIETLEYAIPTKVAMIGTKRTIESGKYPKELSLKGNGKVEFIQIATPELVPLIEIGEIDSAANHAIEAIENEAGESEVVVLGCTHYTEIKDQLRGHFEGRKRVVSQDEIIPEKLDTYLKRHPEITSRLTLGGERHIHLTEHRPYYDRVMTQLLGGVLLPEE